LKASIAFIGLLAVSVLAQGSPAPLPVVVLTTDLGAIEIAIDTVHAPRTAANFLKYIDAGMYDGGRFTRTVRPETETRTDFPIQVVQGGMNPARTAERLPPIAMESTQATTLKHLDGVISMARSGPDTAADQFFICIGDMPSLDFGGGRNADGQGFAAFGRVVAGMDVVRKIQAAAVAPNSQNLAPPVRIVSARRKPPN
jgi:peptidyl-prolyl cis-trans isomerase A (cyclophilin A)